MNSPREHQHVIPIKAEPTAPARNAYTLAPPTSRDDLVRVGRGTPMGELLRRYWHPVGMAADAGSTPRQVTVLGEELILFRSGQGEAGPLYPRCAHRGTSLL